MVSPSLKLWEKYTAKFFRKERFIFLTTTTSALIAILFALLSLLFFLRQTIAGQTMSVNQLQKSLTQAQQNYLELKNQDQYKRNQDLQKTIGQIEDTYGKTSTLYNSLVDLKLQTTETKDFDARFAKILSLLSKKNYSSASADIISLTNDINQKSQELAAKNAPAANTQSAPASNTPPASGYSQQTVTTDTGTFVVSMIAADLNSTRVIVDTASDSDCNNNCPTLPLATYAQRSGAYAAINGTFFCPVDYPSCADKTGSFDTLLMNKNKVYFNSANNVYSTVPLVYFTGNSMGVRTASSQWGRDTGVDSVIAMQPLLVLSQQIVYSNSSDTKYTNKGTRDFIANKGSTVYIGVMYNANMTDSAHVLKTLGMDNALNLDEGGSTALWLNGQYLAGPGRNIPNAVLFVRK